MVGPGAVGRGGGGGVSATGAGGRRSHEVCEAHLARSGKCGRKNERFSYAVDGGALAQAELMDGKLQLVSNVADLSPTQLVQRYKALADIEPVVKYYEPFRDLAGNFWAQAALLKVSALAGMQLDKEAETLGDEIRKNVTDPETARAAQLPCLHAGATVGHITGPDDLPADLGTFTHTFLLAMPRRFAKSRSDAAPQAAG